MNYLTRSNGDEYGPRMPFITDNLDGNKTAEASETITYNGKAVAGAVTVNALSYHPVMSEMGERVASYWGLDENLVYTSNGEVAIVETAGSATAIIVDSVRDLEKAFESLTTTVKRYILKVTDNQNNSLYGWIFGVAKSTNAYTFDIFNTRLTEGNQNWVGTLGNFDATRGCKAEIYVYNSSVAFGTGTTLTEEIRPPSGEYFLNWKKLLDYANDTLTDGQYFWDYMRALVVGKRADTTASETITYNIDANAEIEITSSGVSGTLVDDAVFTPATSAVTPVGFFADETATDSIDEGDIGAARITLDRKQISAGQHVDDAAFTVASHYTNVIGALADETATDSVDEGDSGALRMTLNRRLIIAGQTLDDAAFGVGTEYVNATGFLADETATDSVDEGDIGLARMTLTRKIITASEFQEDTAHTTADYGSQVLTVYKTTAAQQAGTDGDYAPLLTNSTGHLHTADGFAPQAEDNTNGVIATMVKPLAVTTYAWTMDRSTALEASSVTKASAGVIRAMSGRIDSTHATGTYYIQILNAASLPADGAVTTLAHPLKIQHTAGTDSNFSMDFTQNGIYASTGLVWCISTTEFSKTISGAFVSASVLYV